MAYPQSTQLKIRRFFVKGFIRVAIKILLKVEVIGWENVPKNGAYLICHNHVSIIDPPLVASFWPTNAEIVGAAELMTRRGQAFIVRMYRLLWVKRGEPERELLRKMVEVLKAGTPLQIAPEGTRTRTPGLVDAQPGVGYLLEKVNVPVLPVAVIGGTDENIKKAFKLKRPKVVMKIGEVFEVPEITSKGAARREARKANADRVMVKICELLPEEYWGAYAEQFKEYREAGR